MSAATGGLRLVDISFGYGEVPLLDGASLEVPPGEVMALCGPNGCGKSTLLKVAAGLLAPRSGEVLCGGEPVARMKRLNRAKHIAYLPQSPILPEGWSVASAVALGDYPHAALPPAPRPLRERLGEARARFHLEELWDRRVETLSGGERRRVLLARTAVQDAPGLVLDEPAADLDLGHQVELFRHLAGLAREGRSILLATHDLNLSLLFAHRMLLMDGKGGVHPFPPSPEAVRATLEGVFGVTLGTVRRDGEAFYLPELRGPSPAEVSGGAPLPEEWPP